jgi:hypothetical protein
MLAALTVLLTLVVLGVMLEAVAWVRERRMAQGDLAWPLVASRRMPTESRGGPGHRFHVLTPGATYEWQGIPVSINSAGFRDREWRPTTPYDARRILVIGDSVVFGWAVGAAQRFGNLIDLLPVYREACEAVGPGACDGYVNHLFADVWMHPNARGHRLAANVLLERLR